MANKYLDELRKAALKKAFPPLTTEEGEVNPVWQKRAEVIGKLGKPSDTEEDTADTSEPPAQKAKPKPYYAPKVPHAGEAKMTPEEMEAVANAPAPKRK